MLWLFNSLLVWLGIAKATTVLPKPNFKNGFQINGVDFDGDESGYLSGITPGTVAASKALVVDSGKDIASLRQITAESYVTAAGGNVGVVPPDSTKGYAQITASNNVGATVTSIVIAGQTGARTYAVPDAGGSANVALDKAFACLTAAGAALMPASSAEAIITGGTKNISAGELTAGNVIRFRAAVKVNAINATDTLTVRARIGAVTASLTGTVCASHISGATTAANDIVILDGYIDMQSFSTPNMTMVATGVGHGLLAGVSGVSTATLTPAFTINTVNAVDLSITIQFSTNSGTNSATLHSFTHEIKAS